MLPAVEIDSSFSRSHRPETYARWAESAPEAFRFSVKTPREITHLRRLVGVDRALRGFLSEVAALGPKLGVILVQLPPSLPFDARRARSFLTGLRERHRGGVALEPRHASWFTPPAEQLMRELRVARVAADPARVPAAARPGGWPLLVYFRLHGSPRTYYSSYGEPFLRSLAGELGLLAQGAEPWCVLDNTAAGAAAANALTLLRLLRTSSR